MTGVIVVREVTPSERARERLRSALDRDIWTQREFARKIGKSQPWLVKILSGENALRLDDLDAVAAVLQMPAAELIRDNENALLELRPSEVRAIRALRRLPTSLLNPVLLILDAIAGNLHLSDNAGQSRGQRKHTNAQRSHGGTQISSDAATELRRLRSYLTTLSVDLGSAIAGTLPAGTVATARPDTTKRGNVAH